MMEYQPAKDRFILIVEDALEIQSLLKQLLELEGFRVKSVSNGAEAIDFLRSTDELPACIFLDLMMPVMDGYEFRELQLQDDRLARIPVIVATADNSLEAHKVGLEAAGMVKKPRIVDAVLQFAQHYCATPDHTMAKF